MAAKKWPSGPPPKEALRFFRAKKLKPGFDYRDVWREEHATAFTVAKAMEADVLTDIRQGLDQALAGGKTFRQFQAELTPRLQEAGWWGRKEVVDPVTGKRVSAQLGSPRRLRTIYRANMRTARGAGQWERARRTVKARPYAVYRLGPSREHRPEHVAWEGKGAAAFGSVVENALAAQRLGLPMLGAHRSPEREARKLGGPHRAPGGPDARVGQPPHRRNRARAGRDRPRLGHQPGPGRPPEGRREDAQRRPGEEGGGAETPRGKAGESARRLPRTRTAKERHRLAERGEDRPAGRECTGRAPATGRSRPATACCAPWRNALDADYDRLWRLARQGQKDMFGPGATGLRALKGLRFLRGLRLTPGVRGALVPRWGRDVGEQTITVAEARRRYGSNLILTGDFDDGGPGHMMAVMDAAVVDVIDSRGMRVRAAWKFDRRRLSPQWRAERNADGLLVQQPPVE